MKPNRAHYRLDTSLNGNGWEPTKEVLCVFHARRIFHESGYRVTGLKAGPRAMSRPIEKPCTECLKKPMRCEHDAQNKVCPQIPGDTCGRDSDKELGGSW